MISVLLSDIAIAAIDLLQEMTDVESNEDCEDAVNLFIDALVRIYYTVLLFLF